jgi:hypothetical protein
MGGRALAACLALICVLATAPLRQSAAPPCSHDFVSAITRAHTTTSQHKPQLSIAQMLWISSVLQTYQGHHPATPLNFLVFGLGADTPGWLDANCQGRTVFLENNAHWLELATKELAKDYNHTLEAYTVAYKGRMDQPDAFFSSPWLLEVPAAVSELCCEVILVDAPWGFDPKQGKSRSWAGLGAALRAAALLRRAGGGRALLASSGHASLEAHAAAWARGCWQAAVPGDSGAGQRLPLGCSGGLQRRGPWSSQTARMQPQPAC